MLDRVSRWVGGSGKNEKSTQQKQKMKKNQDMKNISKRETHTETKNLRKNQDMKK